MVRLKLGRNAASEVLHKLNPIQIGKRFYVPSEVLAVWIKTGRVD